MAVTGSLQEKNGKYYAVLNLKDKDGNRRQKWINTGFTIKGNKKRAEIFMQQQIAAFSEEEENRTDNMLFSDYLEDWLVKIKGTIRPNSYRSYEGNMRNHVIPYFKDKGYLLSEISPMILEEYYEQKKKEGLSVTTIRHHRENISKAFNDAIHDEILKGNPVQTSKLPRGKKFHPNFLTPVELDRLMLVIKGSVIELPVKLCTFYGFRRSEVLGLKWDQVNFERKTITVCETLQQFPGGDYTDDPKTDESHRTLPMNEQVLTILLEQKKQQELYASVMGNSYINSGYVCTWPDGRVISPNYLTRTFHDMLEDSHLPHVRLHDLRHSTASNLLQNGASLPAVSSWVGHSSPETTLRFYAHANMDDKKAISGLVEKMINIV